MTAQALIDALDRDPDTREFVPVVQALEDGELTPQQARARIEAMLSGEAKAYDPLENRDWRGRWAKTTNWLGKPVHLSAVSRRGKAPPPVMMLVTTGQPDMDRYGADGAALGRLFTPRMTDAALATQAEGVPFALDNDGFWGVHEDEYKKMAEDFAAAGLNKSALWVSAPDELGDAQATQKRFEQWSPYLHHLGLKAAYVAQNGSNSAEGRAWLEQHWGDIDAVFLGGDDRFKLGRDAYEITQLAHEHGKIVHMGRVNTGQRLVYARDVVGADTSDGSGFARFKDSSLPQALHQDLALDPPHYKRGQEWVREAVQAAETGHTSAAYQAEHPGAVDWPEAPKANGLAAPRDLGLPTGPFASRHARRAARQARRARERAHEEQIHNRKRKAIGDVRFLAVYEAVADALGDAGISDRAYLEMTPGVPGFSIRCDDAQLAKFEQRMAYYDNVAPQWLPEVERSGDVASWPDVLVMMVDPGAFEDDPAAFASAFKAFDPHEVRDAHGRWTGGPGGGLPLPWQTEPLGLTDERLDKFAKESFAGQLPDPDTQAPEGHALHVYQGAGYGAINTPLREGKQPVSRAQDMVRTLDAVTTRTHTTTPMTVFRSIDTSALGDVQPGDEIQDKGFVSTSLMRTLRGGGPGEATMEIRLPAGTPAFSFDQWAAAGTDDYTRMNMAYEHEVLLPRGGKFRIISHDLEGGRQHVVAEYGAP